MQELKDTIEALIKVLKYCNKKVDENFPFRIAEIVKSHSVGAATSAVASGWIPGAGAGIATTISAGFIWTMYGKINSECSIPFSENVVKSLATGLATNLASYVVGGLVMSTALSFIPGLGSIGASAVIGATCYAMTLASGIVYLKVLTSLMSSGANLSTMSEEELKQRANNITNSMNIKETIDKAKQEYKK